ncbi:MAG: alanine--tRNA ligase [candidate division WOR-3 bacterium]|nr:alanine--tRNA ligase [candidate division WOR-3 bacterium]
MQSSDELVKIFLDFFKEKDHKIVESSSLIPERDKTLLFTSAGMVQFKPLWTGEVPLEFKRAASVQKCLRLSDLNEVGKTYCHDTFFEMLGNFSFGDYFKEEAIRWAWKFLVDVLDIPPEKLYISVYPDDDESYKIWKDKIGVSQGRIIRNSENFWGPAGGRGACGPDTEIFYDLGEKFGKCEFDGECDRYIEFWNLVFPQFDEREGGRFPLKNSGVDTGMGMERLAMIIQGKSSIFETDLFLPIIQETEKISGREYFSSKRVFNIIADHSRALVFAIGDGVYPGNVGRGYVIRRLIRRGLTVSREIGIEEPFLHKLVPVVISIMKGRYPYLREKIEHITLIIKKEEENFFDTLSAGVSILNEIIQETKKNKSSTIKGEDAFRLYDTYGFPISLTEEMAKEEGLVVDRRGFDEEMKKQKEMARRKQEFEAEEKVDWVIVSRERSRFVGYEQEEIETEVIAYRKVDDYFEVILKETPFYAEKGGQVGDTGKIEGEGWKMLVEDTIPSPLGNIHKGKLEGKFVPSRVFAEINKERRSGIRRNHTTTHILQRVLRETLGEWVKQEGSLVAPDHLRFDFTHPNPLSDQEIQRIEEEVNKVILKGLPVKKEILPYDEAIQKGAIALFEEQYGEKVRMVSISDFSRELCGGTHLNNTIEAGLFKITSETGVASGIRRIEAVTGWFTYKWMKELDQLVQEMEFLLEIDRESLPIRIEKTLNLLREQKRRIERMENQLAEIRFHELLKETSRIKEQKYIAARVDGSRETLRKLAERLREKMPEGVGLLATELDSSVFAVSFVGDKLKNKLNAGEIIQEACRIVKGGGGGSSTRAEGGGSKVEKLEEMLNKFPEILKEHLK